MKLKDEIGNRYGRLLVLRRERSRGRGASWRCRCDCGEEVIVSGILLRNGETRSCGCLKLETHRLPKGEAAFNSICARMKKEANNCGRSWDLTKDQVKGVIFQPCFYCGAQPSQLAGYRRDGHEINGTILYNGLDRVDNDKGYTLDNIVTCCGECNRGKREGAQEEYIQRCNRIAERHPRGLKEET